MDGRDHEDFEGVLYRGRTSNAPGIASGSMDYAAGLARDGLRGGARRPPPSRCRACGRGGAVEHGQHLFRTQSAPLKPGGVVLSVLDLHGNALTATTGTDGAFAGTTCAAAWTSRAAWASCSSVTSSIPQPSRTA
ncbi:hypothetical protein GO496_10540 [Acidovorax citrulli]|nr:hypothetical protein [Paracidovorax citrulli]